GLGPASAGWVGSGGGAELVEAAGLVMGMVAVGLTVAWVAAALALDAWVAAWATAAGVSGVEAAVAAAGWGPAPGFGGAAQRVVSCSRHALTAFQAGRGE